MISLQTIYDEAVILRGGEDKVLQRLAVPKTEQQLCALNDSEYLSIMSRRIFRAGLKHSMVDAKWPAFEEVFSGFDIDIVRMMSDEDLDVLMKDKRIIRHWGKIKSVRANAAVISEMQQEYSGFGDYISNWPGSRIVELWQDLKKRFVQLGGNSGPYFLRMSGKDTFLLTRDVVRALNRHAVFEGEATSIKARNRVQEAFNQWSEESGRPLCQISMILALSTD